MNIRKIFLVIITISVCGCFFAGTVSANFKMKDAGTTTAQFLKLGVGARAIGMAESAAAVTNDAGSIYWNPAGLALVSEQQITMMHAVWFESIFYDFCAYARPIGGYGVAGFGVQYLSAGKIKETNNEGVDVGYFKPNDMAVSLAWAEDYNDLLVGVTLKYITMEIKEPASVFAADIGMIYPFLINDGKIAFTAQNLGGKVKFDREKESLPVNFKLGFSVHPSAKLLVALDINAPVDYNPYASIGLEYPLDISGDFSLAFRTGYNSHTLKSNLGGVTGLAGGIGFGLWDCVIDYAWVPYGDLGQTHRISFGYKF